MNFGLWFDIYWFDHSHMALFFMLFDELKCYNTVSFKLRSLKWRAEYRFLHSSHIYFKMLLAYYCNTQKQSSGEFAKFTGKELCRSPFLNKAAGGRPIKNEAPKGLRPAALSKRDSSTGVFPWILRDFLEHLFCIWLSYVTQNRCFEKSR